MTSDNQQDLQDLFEYLTEASETVSNWPTWKQLGSDATQFQDTNKSQNTYNKQNNTGFALKRAIIP